MAGISNVRSQEQIVLNIIDTVYSSKIALECTKLIQSSGIISTNEIRNWNALFS